MVGNFIFMSVCFAINRGTVTSLIAIASSQLGSELGGEGVAVLYVAYVATALTVAALVVVPWHNDFN